LIGLKNPVCAIRREDRSHTELADALRSRGAAPKADVQQLWFWLSEDTGPIKPLDMLMGQADSFNLSRAQALQVLADVHKAVRGWRTPRPQQGRGREHARPGRLCADLRIQAGA